MLTAHASLVQWFADDTALLAPSHVELQHMIVVTAAYGTALPQVYMPWLEEHAD